MATRTLKLRGMVWGNPANPATLTVSWNSTQVFSGTVDTVEGVPDRFIIAQNMPFLCTWTNDTSQSGFIPLVLTISGGVMAWGTIVGNYYQQESDAQSYAAWRDGMQADIDTLTEAQFDAKYGWTKVAAEEAIALNSPANTYVDISGIGSVDSDGHDNVVINGVPGERTVWEDEIGAWTWIIPDGGTLTCDVKCLQAYAP